MAVEQLRSSDLTFIQELFQYSSPRCWFKVNQVKCFVMLLQFSQLLLFPKMICKSLGFISLHRHKKIRLKYGYKYVNLICLTIDSFPINEQSVANYPYLFISVVTILKANQICFGESRAFQLEVFKQRCLEASPTTPNHCIVTGSNY